MSSIDPRRVVTENLVNQAQQAVVGSYDPSYIHSVPGSFKMAGIIISAIGYISAMLLSCTNCGSLSFLSLVTGLSFWMTLMFFMLHIFSVTSTLPTIPWPSIEMIYTGAWTVLFIISALSTFGFSSSSFFIFFVSSIGAIIYGYECWLNYQDYLFLRQRVHMSDGPNETV